MLFRSDNLVGAHPDGDIGLKIVEIGGLKIAGLPGVFRPRIWSGSMAEPPGFPTRRDFLASLRPDELWRGGLPLWHRDSIFPEDIDLLSSQPIDVLVCHEAPTAHPHGLDAIDTVARRTGARLVVHGHHHTSYDAMIDGAVRVRGLALAETWVMSLD